MIKELGKSFALEAFGKQVKLLPSEKRNVNSHDSMRRAISA